MFRTTLLAGLAALALTSLATTAAAASFDFGTVAAGTTPTFSITQANQTATFSSPAGNGFAVQNTSGLLSFPTALLDNNFFSGDPLTISFSRPVVDRVLIPFAILDAFGAGDALNVTTNTGASYTFGTAPNALILAEPEGRVSFVPAAAISSLTLSSNGGLAFAIGNVDVPEPASLTLLCAGLAGILAARRRRL